MGSLARTIGHKKLVCTAYRLNPRHRHPPTRPPTWGPLEKSTLSWQGGLPIIDADLISHEVIEPSGGAYKKVVEAFQGEGQLLEPDGRINRKR